jgi:prepilin-type processing-associated H-X9-DG protein
LTCPTATRVVQNNQDWGTYKAWIRQDQANRYPAPNEGPTIDFVASYGINSWTNYMIAARGHRPAESFWKSTQNASNRNSIPVFADSTWNDAWPWSTDTPIEQPLDFHWGSPGTSDEMNHFCIDRHSGFVNFLFMDWSVRKVGLKELWTLKWHRDFNVNGPWTKGGGVLPTDWPKWLRKYKDY